MLTQKILIHFNFNESHATQVTNIKRTALISSTLIFVMDVVVFCDFCSEIFEFCHIFEDYVACILFTSHFLLINCEAFTAISVGRTFRDKSTASGLQTAHVLYTASAVSDLSITVAFTNCICFCLEIRKSELVICHAPNYCASYADR
jgi:hypothetical protein